MSKETLVLAALVLGIVIFIMIIQRLGGKTKMAQSSLKELIKNGAHIIDVRTKEEFAEEAYPKAKNIPLSILEAKLSDAGKPTDTIIVYCASGARSAQAARILKFRGYTNVINAGGLEDMPE